jgi:hypothetical protein
MTVVGLAQALGSPHIPYVRQGSSVFEFFTLKSRANPAGHARVDSINSGTICRVQISSRGIPEAVMHSTPPNLADVVQSAITGNPYLAGRTLRFEAEAGRVVLQGTVSTYFQKQMAQEALRRIDGIREIENQLEVSWA